MVGAQVDGAGGIGFTCPAAQRRRKLKTKVVTLVAFLSLGVSAIAQDDRAECFSPPGTVTPAQELEMLECFSKVRSNLSAELSQLLQNPHIKIGPRDGNLRSLQETQQLWNSYRNAACKAARDQVKTDNASGRWWVQIVDNRCVIRMTRARIADIRETYITTTD